MNTLIIDTETGGLSPINNALCSVALKVYGKEISKEIFILPHEELEYDKRAMEITGITKDYLLKKGIPEKNVIREILTFINENFDGRPFVLGHNVGFDIQFLDALFKRHTNARFSELVHIHRKDTMLNMLFLRDSGLVDCPSLSLVNCYSCLSKKDPENTHSALGDVLITEELYRLQLELIKNKEN